MAAGFDDAGSVGDPDPSSYEVTHFVSLRDHSNKVFYYRCVIYSVSPVRAGMHTQAAAGGTAGHLQAR